MRRKYYRNELDDIIKDNYDDIEGVSITDFNYSMEKLMDVKHTRFDKPTLVRDNGYTMSINIEVFMRNNKYTENAFKIMIRTLENFMNYMVKDKR